MAKITFKGNLVNTCGKIPSIGQSAPNFNLLTNSLATVTLNYYKGKNIVLNIFPSLDTPTCATSVRTFNQKATSVNDTVVLNISADLPFAQARFCASEGINNSQTLSTFNTNFAKDYGLQIIDSPLAGLCSRVVIVINKEGNIIYNEQVNEIADEPNYQAALNSLNYM